MKDKTKSIKYLTEYWVGLEEFISDDYETSKITSTEYLNIKSEIQRIREEILNLLT